MQTVTSLLYVRAIKDANGNPRRGWVVKDDHGFRWVEEGFGGNDPLINALGFNTRDNGSHNNGIEYILSVKGRRMDIGVRLYNELRSGNFSGVESLMNMQSHFFKGGALA